MRNGYRHPLAGTVLMALLFALIGVVVFVMTGSIVPFGSAVLLIFVAGIATAAIATLIRFALRRTGVHRLAEVRTWPQD